VILAVQGLKEYLGHPYRKLMDVLREMPRVTKSLGLTPETVPHFSTVCTRKQTIPMKQWRAILDQSVELSDLGNVQAIDATGIDRIQASQHYAKRTDYTFEAVKTTLLIDCETSAILDIHCSMKQPHDTQVGWQVLVRNLDDLATVAADKGYDWEELRTRLRAESITPLIPQRDPGIRGGRETCSSRIERITSARTLNRCFSDSDADTVIRSGREPGSGNSVNLS